MGLSDEDHLQCSEHQRSKNVVLNIDVQVVTDESTLKQTTSKRKDFNRSQHHFSPRDRRRKLYGVRQLRRVENLNFLLSQAEADEDDSGEVDFVDLVSQQNSVFRELFMEPEKMSAWVAFVNSSEEEQEHVLATSE
jgi:hypothetical protein